MNLRSLAMQISINGTYIDGWTYAHVHHSFLTACKDFQFISANRDRTTDPYPVQKGDACQIIVEGQQVLDGFVDTVEGLYSAQENTIVVTGRSKTMDVIDSTLDYTLFSELQGGVSLVNITILVLQRLGLNKSIDVIVSDDALQGANLILPLDNYLRAAIGETAFNFIEKYAQLQQIIVTTDNLGNLVFTRGTDQDIINYQLTTKINDTFNENNVVSCQWSDSERQRFNFYRCWSAAPQGSIDYNSRIPGRGGSPIVAKENTSLRGNPVFDTRVRPSRHFSFTTQVPFTQNNFCTQRALWQANYMKAKGFSYQPTLKDHTYGTEGKIWQTNQLVQVYDEKADINSQLLVAEVNFTESLGTGNITQLTLVLKDSFQLKIQQEYYQARYSDGSARYSQDVKFPPPPGEPE